MARPRVSKRTAPGPTTRKENLSSLSTEVLRLRLQALKLPITGSRAQLIRSLKKAVTPPSSRPAKQNRVSKRSRGHLPAKTNRAEAKEKGAPADSLVDRGDSDLDLSDQGDEDPMPVDLPAHAVEDLLSAPDPVQSSSSLFTSDQLRAIQDTVQSSISGALHGGQSQPGTSASQVLPRPKLPPSGTASLIIIIYTTRWKRTWRTKSYRVSMLTLRCYYPTPLLIPSPPRFSSGWRTRPQVPLLPQSQWCVNISQ